MRQYKIHEQLEMERNTSRVFHRPPSKLIIAGGETRTNNVTNEARQPGSIGEQ